MLNTTVVVFNICMCPGCWSSPEKPLWWCAAGAIATLAPNMGSFCDPEKDTEGLPEDALEHSRINRTAGSHWWCPTEDAAQQMPAASSPGPAMPHIPSLRPSFI